MFKEVFPRWRDDPHETGLSMLQKEANIPEIGATEPEKTEKRGCNIPFYSRVNKKTLQNQNALC